MESSKDSSFSDNLKILLDTFQSFFLKSIQSSTDAETILNFIIIGRSSLLKQIKYQFLVLGTNFLSFPKICDTILKQKNSNNKKK